MASIGDDFAHVPQLVDIQCVDLELMVGDSIWCIFGMGPALKGSRTGVDDGVWLGTGKIRGKRHIEGQIHRMTWDCWVGSHDMC